MADLKGQHVCIKFCFKLGKYAVKTFEMLEVAFDELTMGRRRVFEWFSKFKSGRTSVEGVE